MNWIESNSWVNESVTLGSCRINHLLFDSTACIFWNGLQHALDQFSVACDQAGMKFSTKKIRALCFFRNSSQQTLWAAMHCSRWRSFWGGTHEWQKVEQGDWHMIHKIIKQTQFCMSFIALWSQNGSFQTLQSYQFLNPFYCDAHPWLVILGDNWMSAI